MARVDGDRVAINNRYYDAGYQCSHVPEPAECFRLLDYILKSVESNHLAIRTAALSISVLRQHRGFTSEDVATTLGQQEHGYRAGSTTAEWQRIMHKLAMNFLLRGLALSEPFDQRSACFVSAAILLSGTDAACAMLREIRSEWLRSELARPLPSPIEAASTVDRISGQVSADQAVISSIAGSPRWRILGELYQASSNELVNLVRQSALKSVQRQNPASSTQPPIDLTNTAAWLNAVQKAEELQSREAVAIGSARPKSGSRLKRQALDEINDSTLSGLQTSVAVFLGAISSAVEKLVDQPQIVSYGVSPGDTVLLRPDSDEWPLAITPLADTLWKVISDFCHLGFILLSCQSTSLGASGGGSAAGTALDSVNAVMAIFASKRLAIFNDTITGAETVAYLALADCTYFERQLHALKLREPKHHHVFNPIHDMFREQVESMSNHLITLRSRLVDAVLYDWRPLLAASADDRSTGPPAALVAWPIQLRLWFRRFSSILSRSLSNRIYLCVVLASLERLAPRLLNCDQQESVLLALRVSADLMLDVSRSPEELKDESPHSSVAVQQQLRYLQTGCHAVATTLARRLFGNSISSPSWILAGVTPSHAIIKHYSDGGLLLLSIAYKKPRNSPVSLLRFVRSSLNMVAEEDSSAEALKTFLQLSNSISSRTSDAEFLGRVVSVYANLAPDACLSFLVDTLATGLDLCLSKPVNMQIAAESLPSNMPCGCNPMEQTMFNVIEQLPLIFSTGILSHLKLAIGALDSTLQGLPHVLVGTLERLGFAEVANYLAYWSNVPASKASHEGKACTDLLGEIRRVTTDIWTARMRNSSSNGSYEDGSKLISEAAAVELVAALPSTELLKELERVICSNPLLERLLTRLFPEIRADQMFSLPSSADLDFSKQMLTEYRAVFAAARNLTH